MIFRVIHAYLRSGAGEDKYDKYSICKNRISFIIKFLYYKIFYDYVEIFTETQFIEKVKPRCQN